MITAYHSHIEEIINGMLLILKYQPKAMIYVGHDVIYFGKSNDYTISKEDLQLLSSWGWYEDEELWAKNV